MSYKLKTHLKVTQDAYATFSPLYVKATTTVVKPLLDIPPRYIVASPAVIVLVKDIYNNLENEKLTDAVFREYVRLGLQKLNHKP